MNWDDVAEDGSAYGMGNSVLKGIMSVADAKRAVQIGCTGIILSNHGGRQLDGSRAAFDQLAEIVDVVGDRIDVIMDGGNPTRNPRTEGAFRLGPRPSESDASISILSRRLSGGR